MKDLVLLSYFLGLEVSFLSYDYYLTLEKYASNLISRAGITGSKTANTPIEYNSHLTPSGGKLLLDATRYKQLVGGLVYLIVTRPDISYVVHIVSKFMAAPRSFHYASILRMLQYLNRTIFCGLQFSFKSPLILRAYSDAYWAGDPTEHKSTTRYYFLLGNSLISWRSKKQTIVARSSTETKYCALVDTTTKLQCLHWLLQDLGVNCSTAIPIYCDNQSAIQIVHNNIFNERTKHIKIDYHFICHCLLQSALELQSTSSQDLLVEIFTKPSPPGCLHALTANLKLTSLHLT